MKCKKSEEIIYLYLESSERDRVRLSEHILGCGRCAKLFQEVQLANKLIAEAAGQRSMPADPGVLTNSIMRSLPDADASESLWTHVLGLFDLSVVKYSMALASFMFIGIFLTQYQETEGDVLIHSNVQTQSAGIVIRSSGLREEFMTREKRASLLECTMGMANKIDLDCVKEKIEKLSF